MGQLPFTPRAKKVLELSMEEAQNLGHNYIGTEHLLLGLIKENEGIAAQVLMNLGIKLEDVREEVLDFLGRGQLARRRKESSVSEAESRAYGTSKSKTPALDSFGRDLTELASEGKLDVVIGRANEIERVIQILSRRTKNNPVLLGEPGRRQDRHRRRPRAADRRTTRFPRSCAASASWSSTLRSWSPARSTAASSRSASRRS